MTKIEVTAFRSSDETASEAETELVEFFSAFLDKIRAEAPRESSEDTPVRISLTVTVEDV